MTKKYFLIVFMLLISSTVWAQKTPDEIFDEATARYNAFKTLEQNIDKAQEDLKQEEIDFKQLETEYQVYAPTEEEKALGEIEEVTQEANQEIQKAEEKVQTQQAPRVEQPSKRKSFGKQDKISSLEQNYIQKNAFAAEEFTGTSETGVFLIPEALVEFCKLTEEDAKDEMKIQECIEKVYVLRYDKNQAVRDQANSLVSLTEQQVYYSSLSEAMIAKTEGANTDDVLNPLEQASAEASDEKDAISSLVAIEVQNAKLLNSLLKIYAADISMNAYQELGRLKNLTGFDPNAKPDSGTTPKKLETLGEQEGGEE